MQTTTFALTTALLAGVAGVAGAADIVEITVNPALSTVDLEICQDLPVVGGCDSDMSPLTGTATFRVDTGAGTVELLGFAFQTSESLDYTYTGLASQVDATVPVVDVFFDQPAPAGPVPLTAGAFSFMDVGTNLAGTATVTGSVLLIGAVNETIALGDFGPFVAPLSGTLTDDGMGNYTLEGSFMFDEETVGDVMGIMVTSSVNGSIVIEGTGVAVPESCPADIDNDGDADPDDINAFVTAFIASDPAADIDNDGDEDPDDITAFVTAFIAGC